MKISMYTRWDRPPATHNGFGYATECITASLTELGYEWEWSVEDADVEFAFEQPHQVNWRAKEAYRVLMVPWESTALPVGPNYRRKGDRAGWLEIMNEADEVWTPSHLIKEWFSAAGVATPIYVFEHGVDSVWSPFKRERKDKLRFMTLGIEAARKGGWDTLTVFRKAFPHNQDVELTLKGLGLGWGIERVGKTNIINKRLSFSELQDLYYGNDVYISLTSGEGFGLPQLQALASSMPVIMAEDIPPYKRFLDPKLSLPSELRNSPWRHIHPGKVLRPDLDAAVDRLRYCYDNFDDVASKAHELAPIIHKEYDWNDLTDAAFRGLKQRVATHK